MRPYLLLGLLAALASPAPSAAQAKPDRWQITLQDDDLLSAFEMNGDVWV